MTYSRDELEEAKSAIVSLLNKCEKASVRLAENTSQRTLLTTRIKALIISQDLIEKEISELTIKGTTKTTTR